ncbi:hypothetical protein [Rathayibacter sp. AY1A7]|uniref:hypothetical protein n=1 Tax=Rathayibacter sp. AY1A7 TaxID=2080524 RepID=UPI000CE7820F|nr:hypothetical protein [Rathayibacter sp. AY1A7]PPF21330.1 hypothetical protein C5B95_05775 [Rathayibacter sp. AY1A7]
MPPLDTRTPTPRLAASRRPLDVVAIAAAALVNECYLDRRFTVHHLAAELRMPALLLRLRFRRCYGLGLDEHLALRRLELAAVLMASTPVALGGLDRIARGSGYRGTAELDRDHRRHRRSSALAAWFRAAPRPEREHRPGIRPEEELLAAAPGAATPARPSSIRSAPVTPLRRRA